MPKFGSTSRTRLKTCHPLLQKLFDKVIQNIDCTILCGHRGEEEQNKAYELGRSKAKWGESPHNMKPSMAVDVAIYHQKRPHIRWNDIKEFYFFAGYVMAMAKELGISITWGGDWDKDYRFDDQKFIDMPHFELTNWRTWEE